MRSVLPASSYTIYCSKDIDNQGTTHFDRAMRSSSFISDTIVNTLVSLLACFHPKTFGSVLASLFVELVRFVVSNIVTHELSELEFGPILPFVLPRNANAPPLSHYQHQKTMNRLNANANANMNPNPSRHYFVSFFLLWRLLLLPLETNHVIWPYLLLTTLKWHHR